MFWQHLSSQASNDEECVKQKPWVMYAGLVETSSNLAAVRCEADAASPSSGECAITCSSRSSLMPALEAVRGSIAKLASLVLPKGGEMLVKSCRFNNPACMSIRVAGWPRVRCFLSWC